MIRIVAGGTGFVGQHLINKWLPLRIKVIVVGRSREKIQQVFGANVEAVTWTEWLSKGPEMARQAQFILNLAGSNIGENRWTDVYKKDFLMSRLQTTKALVDVCSALGEQSPPLLNASAVGIYGRQAIPPTGMLPDPLDEDSPLKNTNTTPDFLSQLAQAWEKQTDHAKTNGVRVINLRFGVILGDGGGVLTRLSLPFKFWVGGVLGSGLQPFPWVHLSDVGAVIDFVVNHPEISGPINVVAPQEISQKELAYALGRALHRPVWFNLPTKILKLAFGEMAEELLLNGQNVKPSRLTSAGFQFKYPTIDSALANIYRAS